MTIAWFLVPYVRKLNTAAPSRYLAIDDFTSQIATDGGSWAETEVLGNKALVKVNASDATLATLDGLYYKIPVAALDNTLASLNTAQKNALKTQINNLGYNDAEITAALGNNLGSRTLRQVLQFICTRRNKVRYSQAIDDFVFDGPVVEPTSFTDVDAQVQ